MELQSTKQLLGKRVAVKDGHIGKCKDILLDRDTLALRYFVVDPHPWLPASHKVLLTSTDIDRETLGEAELSFELSKEVVEKAPSLADHQPVSREYEAKFFRYYGYASYWSEPGLAGTDPRAAVVVEDETSRANMNRNEPQSHLRSVVELLDYDVLAQGEKTGRIEDLLLDPRVWRVTDCRILNRHLWHKDERANLPLQAIKKISWFDKTITLEAAA